MKTLKITLLIITSLTTVISFAQNNILPANGNIGIGTLNPNVKLEVCGKMKVDSAVKFKNKLVVDGLTKIKDKLVIDGLTRMNGDAKLFGDLNLRSLEDLNLSENRILTIQPDGVVSNITQADLSNALSQVPCLQLADESGQGLPPTIFATWVQKPNPDYGILHTGAGQCSNTRVGIGTENPLAPLHVIGKGLFGSLEVGAGGIKVLFPAVNFIKAFTVVNNVTNEDVFRVMSDGSLNISTDMSQNIKSFVVSDLSSGDDVFKVMSDGSLNISTDMSQNVKPLSVTDMASGKDIFKVMSNGNVYATKILVRTTPFPDYVFKQDYNLMPLPELETYIKMNKHLPNMPTAKSVEKNGADLGEMNRVLVEKTEELTLYIIALKKELDNLKEEVSQLKK